MPKDQEPTIDDDLDLLDLDEEGVPSEEDLFSNEEDEPKPVTDQKNDEPKPDDEIEATPKSEENEPNKSSTADDEEIEGAVKDKDGRIKTVPYGALHAEREKRKEFAAKLEKTNKRHELMQQRLDQMMQMQMQQMQQMQQPNIQQPPQAQTQTPIDPEEDPYAYMQQLEQNQRVILEQQQNFSQQQQQMQQQQAIRMEGERQAAVFRNEVGPDKYDSAFHHMMSVRTAELKAMGATDDAIAQTLHAETENGIVYALQNGVNPGKMLWDMAIARGYNPDTQPQTQPPAQDPDKLKKVRGLGGGGQNPGAMPGTVEDLANMTDAEFQNWLKKNGSAGVEKAFMAH
jgi:hypothetical protein